MTDDYDSHDKLLPHYSFVYNSRLNIANIQKELYDLYNTGAMITYTNGYVANFDGMSPTYFDGTTLTISKLVWLLFSFTSAAAYCCCALSASSQSVSISV